MGTQLHQCSSVQGGGFLFYQRSSPHRIWHNIVAESATYNIYEETSTWLALMSHNDIVSAAATFTIDSSD